MEAMIISLCWIPKGASLCRPKKDDEQVAHLQEDVQYADSLQRADAEIDQVENADTEIDAILDMQNYDNEDTAIELLSEAAANLFHISNKEDQYLISDNSDSDEDDEVIRPTDSLIVCATDDNDSLSQLEVYICENPGRVNENNFVRNDIKIPSCPLSIAWLDCPLKGGDRGNFIAVGSKEPSIEIWNLDIRNAQQPSVVLGGLSNKASIRDEKDSHTDAVIGLAWNKEFRNILASSSVDELVKVWDLATKKCKMTMNHHTKEVQAVAWNHRVPEVLLSGSFDCTVVMKDVRVPSHPGFKWLVGAEVDSLAWDPHTEHSYAVGLENGTVKSFDIRTASSDPSNNRPCFDLHAHDKAVCSISYNPAAPNLLATGSADKMVKLWDLSKDQPSCVASKNHLAGAVFCIAFSDDDPFLLAIGGSKGKLKIWDTMSVDEVSRRFSV